MTSINDDYLYLGELIAARIRDQIDEQRLPTVSDWNAYASIEDAILPMPGAFVLYGGETFSQGAGQGAAQPAEQVWLVVLALKNVYRARHGTGVREDAGPLIASILQALIGWQPNEKTRGLVRAPAPAPSYDVGFGYFPLAFTARTVFKSNNQEN